MEKFLAVVLGCSDKSISTNPPHSTPAGLQPASSPAALTTPEAGSLLPVMPLAYAVSVPPGTVCTIHPDGVTDDPTRSASLNAGADQEVRFRLSPEATAQSAWGTRLALECTLNGSPQGHYVVDLNDSSTFTSKTAADLTPHVVRVRPALTGSLLSMTRSELAAQGYPPRPDPTQSADYAKWVTAVTTPMPLYNAVLVASLGEAATVGRFDGSQRGPGSSGYHWTGFIQAGNGFSMQPEYPNWFFANYGNVWYDSYAAILLAPSNAGCGQTSCADQFMWAGIGGFPVWFFGSNSTDLLQSGFHTNYHFMGAPAVLEFVEFVGTAPGSYPPYDFFPPPGDVLAAGDVFEIYGWVGDGQCQYTTSPTQGCFEFIDSTRNWGQSTFVTPDPPALPMPAGGVWAAATVEYVNEWTGDQLAGMNPNYGGNYMYGTGWDTSGGQHLDPGNAGAGNTSGHGDDYIVETQTDSAGNACSIAEWTNGSINSPADPMFFFAQPCGPQ